MYPTPAIERIVSVPSLRQSSSNDDQEHQPRRSGSNNSIEKKATTAAQTASETKSALKSVSKHNAKKKSVSFYNSCKIKPHMHYTELSWDELDAAFYKPDDYRMFKTEVKRTAKMIEMKIDFSLFEENDYCTRGTEHRTSEGSRIRSKLQRKARNAVFKEQLNQYFEMEDAEETESTYNMDDDGDDCCCYEDDDFCEQQEEEEKFDIYGESTSTSKNKTTLSKLDRQMSNIDKLAAVYSDCVRSSMMSAYMTGLTDEMTAYEISLGGGEYYHDDNELKQNKTDNNDDDDTCSVVSGYSTNSTLFQRHPELLKQKLDNITAALLRFQRTSYNNHHQQNLGVTGTTNENTTTRKIYSSAA